MFKTLKTWWYWWKRGRAWKKFIARELMVARVIRNPVMPFSESTRLEVIADWKKAGHDITVPNFGGKRMEAGINYGY